MAKKGATHSPPIHGVTAPIAANTNGADLTNGICRAVAFSAAGTLHILDAEGTEQTLPSGLLSAGIWHPMPILKVFADSTAANIWVGY